MLEGRDVPPHRVSRPLEERSHNVRVADGKVDGDTEVLLHPPLVEECEAVLRGVNGRIDDRDVKGAPLPYVSPFPEAPRVSSVAGLLTSETSVYAPCTTPKQTALAAAQASFASGSFPRLSGSFALETSLHFLMRSTQPVSGSVWFPTAISYTSSGYAWKPYVFFTANSG